MNLTVQTDRQLLRAEARSTRYLLVTLQAEFAPRTANRLPVHVGIVLDRSGSMAGAAKLRLARAAVEQALRMLRPSDRFTLVVYDDVADVLMSSTLATSSACRLAVQRLEHVEPRGSTDLHAGWTTAAAQMAEHLLHDGVTRVLLLTDGLANVGITEPHALTAQAAELYRRGIATSTFGVGTDFDERLLRDLAEHGRGNAYFIETPVQIADLLTSELGEALEVMHREVVVDLALPPGAECEVISRYRSTQADGRVAVLVGDIVSGQELSLVFRVTMPEDRKGVGVGGHVSARVGAALMDGLTPGGDMLAEAPYVWTYADHEANDGQPRNVIVDREVAQLYAGRARADATEANRHHDFVLARQVLLGTARHIRRYANGDPQLEALWRALEDEVDKFITHLNIGEQKAAFFQAQAQMRGRDPQGKAKRQPSSTAFPKT